MAAPREHWIGLTCKEVNSDLCRLIAGEARPIWIRVGAYTLYGGAVERKVAGHRSNARTRYLGVSRNGECRRSGAGRHAHTGISVGYRSIEGCEVVDRVRTTLGGV